MLQKENRLNKTRDFEKVFKKTRPVFARNLSVRIFQKNASKLPFRAGFIISNKISKLATRRNALKRQLRQILHDLISELKPGYDVIVTVKSDFSYPYKQEEIKAQLIEIFKKANLL